MTQEFLSGGEQHEIVVALIWKMFLLLLRGPLNKSTCQANDHYFKTTCHVCSGLGAKSCTKNGQSGANEMPPNDVGPMQIVQFMQSIRLGGAKFTLTL